MKFKQNLFYFAKINCLIVKSAIYIEENPQNCYQFRLSLDKDIFLKTQLGFEKNQYP